MGLDSVFYVVGPSLSPEKIQRLVWMATSRFGKLELAGQDREAGESHNKFWSLNRYYGKGYERGFWPAIYGLIRLLKSELPDHLVRYGGDSGDIETSQECTPEWLESQWVRWDTSGSELYRHYFNGPGPECCGGPMDSSWGSSAWQEYKCCVCDKVRRFDKGRNEIPVPAPTPSERSE